jgi:hypothetical protein
LISGHLHTFRITRCSTGSSLFPLVVPFPMVFDRPNLCRLLPFLLLLRDVVAAPDIQNVVECAVALDVEASLLCASRLRGANTGGVRAAARCWVRIARGGERKRCDSGDDDEELHDLVWLVRLVWGFGSDGWPKVLNLMDCELLIDHFNAIVRRHYIHHASRTSNATDVPTHHFRLG